MTATVRGKNFLEQYELVVIFNLYCKKVYCDEAKQILNI
jgi:hypothetical protein